LTVQPQRLTCHSCS